MAQIDHEEEEAVLRVLRSGCLSGYLAGTLHGGPEVNALEEEWAAQFGYKHAIAVNSATSGLMAAYMCAGDDNEFIVSPLTMSATATMVAAIGKRIVFGDIERDYLCLSADSVKKAINCDTAAVVVTSLFGQAYDPEINEIAHNAKAIVIEDAAQRPWVGKGDIVVYSLNYHKHIHCGEGGMVCTNNDIYADKLRLIRNHGECGKGLLGCAWKGLYGFNFRLTEIQAAIARVQLKKLPAVLKERQGKARTLSGLASWRPGTEHAWYLYPYLHGAPPDAVEYNSFLPNLPLYKNTPGDYPVAKEVMQRLRVVRP